jgi:hypothetical protein
LPEKNYINAELDFLESRVESLKEYLADNPINEVGDRYGTRFVKGEEVDYVIQTKESIIKCVRDSMKDLATILDQINKLREIEEQKINARGNRDIPILAKGIK